MSKAESMRMSFREAMAYTRRGYAVWWKAAPGMLLATGAHSAVTALSPYVPLYFTARLVNAITGGADAGEVWRMLAALLVSAMAVGAVRAAVSYWDDYHTNGHWSKFNRIFMEKFLSMDFCDVDDPKTDALLDQILQENNYAGWGLNLLYYSVGYICDAVFRILGAVALSVSLFTLPVPQGSPMAWLNHPACLAGMAALLVLSIAASSAMAAKENSYMDNYDGAAGNRGFSFFFFAAIFDHQRGPDVRTYGQDRFFEAGARRHMDEGGYGRKGYMTRMMWGLMGLLNGASQGIGQALTGVIYLFAGLKALGGAFGVGSITQYVGALAGLAQGISSLLSRLERLRANAKFLKNVFELLDTPNNMYQGSLTTEKRSDRKYEIEFRDVSFKYPGTETWALRHVNMKFKIGERLAVVGENGSGKTTFIKLLCRLYDPTEGEVLLNGIDIRKYRYDNYLALFSVVFQDFQLLSQPLGANVAAAMEYDRARVERCLEKAGFKDRLASLPKGLDTCLYRNFEDDGVEVSGGEAQKIALARVLYQDAPFIVLDEPTAALDPEAEAEVYTKFNDIVEDKTAVYISHRLSSCRFCDEVAVFDHGQVVQQGTHDGLVEADGKYRDLWEAQAQYYQNKEAEASA